jgi:small GTP-binding protein
MPEPKRFKAKICLVGEYQVGKTSLIRRYVKDEFDDKYLMTLGAKVSKKEIDVLVDGMAVRANLAIWDFMGQEGFRELFSDAYFSGARGILAVADLTRPSSLKALGPWIESVRSVAGKVPMILAGNKADLVLDAAIPDAELAKFAAAYGCPCLRTSAKTGANVEQAFRILTTTVARQQLASA